MNLDDLKREVTGRLDHYAMGPIMPDEVRWVNAAIDHLHAQGRIVPDVHLSSIGKSVDALLPQMNRWSMDAMKQAKHSEKQTKALLESQCARVDGLVNDLAKAVGVLTLARLGLEEGLKIRGDCLPRDCGPLYDAIEAINKFLGDRHDLNAPGAPKLKCPNAKLAKERGMRHLAAECDCGECSQVLGRAKGW